MPHAELEEENTKRSKNILVFKELSTQQLLSAFREIQAYLCKFEGNKCLKYGYLSQITTEHFIQLYSHLTGERAAILLLIL